MHAVGRPTGWKLEGRPAKVLGVLGGGDKFLLTSQGKLSGGRALEQPGELELTWTCRRSGGRGSRARVEDGRRVSEEEVIGTNEMGWLRRISSGRNGRASWGFWREQAETWLTGKRYGCGAGRPAAKPCFCCEGTDRADHFHSFCFRFHILKTGQPLCTLSLSGLKYMKMFKNHKAPYCGCTSFKGVFELIQNN